jgi:hypothetical protein
MNRRNFLLAAAKTPLIALPLSLPPIVGWLEERKPRFDPLPPPAPASPERCACGDWALQVEGGTISDVTLRYDTGPINYERHTRQECMKVNRHPDTVAVRMWVGP